MADESLIKQDLLIQALTSNAALMAKVTKIADIVPDSQTSPYIVLGEATENPDLLENNDAEILTQIHIWSSYKGRKEVLEIRNLVVAALPEWCLYDGIRIIKDTETNPVWFHGILQIRYFLK